MGNMSRKLQHVRKHAARIQTKLTKQKHAPQRAEHTAYFLATANDFQSFPVFPRFLPFSVFFTTQNKRFRTFFPVFPRFPRFPPFSLLFPPSFLNFSKIRSPVLPVFPRFLPRFSPFFPDFDPFFTVFPRFLPDFPRFPRFSPFSPATRGTHQNKPYNTSTLCSNRRSFQFKAKPARAVLYPAHPCITDAENL